MPRPAILLALVLFLLTAHAQTINPTGPLGDARKALALGDLPRAQRLFTALVHAGPTAVEPRLGLADTELALHHYEAAELDYRQVVFAQPELWIAHKNLVIVEAALGRWSEFDRERALLRAARDRSAPGIRPDEADVIDTFNVTPPTLKPPTQHAVTTAPQHWIVRAYYQPLGRTHTLYNFESFTPTGRVRAYISLESATTPLTLNLTTPTSHATLTQYPTEPTYERVRADVLHYLHTYPTTVP